jgi:hypothetical protein
MTASGNSWHTVRTALNRVERTARRIGHYDQKLASQARAIHRSLQAETEVVREAGESQLALDERSVRQAAWQEIQERSDTLRDAFTVAVNDLT